MRKPPRSLDASGAYERGLWHLSKFSADDNALAQKFFQQAIDLDPTFGGGFTGLARAYFHAAARFQTHSLADVQSLTDALARRAIALDAADAEARSCLAAVLLRRGDYEGALAEAERALAMAPASFDIYLRQRPLWQRPEDHAHMLEGLRKAGWQG
jgi:adenylate cyclase